MNRYLATLAVLLAGLLPIVAFAFTELDPLGPVEPDGQEQLGVYELNLARHDPAAYGDRIGVDLSDIAPQPPLAVNMSLTGSARYHTLDMLENGYFAHVSPHTGLGPNHWVARHGYDLFGEGLDYEWGDANYVESIAYGFNVVPTFPDALALLIEDRGVPSLGHRHHLLATVPAFQLYKEVGFGRARDGLYYWYSIHTGYERRDDVFLTGVVFHDQNANGRYDHGEGQGGVTVTAGGHSTVTMSKGGYSLLVPPGEWAMTCSGGAFFGTATAQVTISENNVEVDFVSGLSQGVVDFGEIVVPAPLDVEVTASVTSGTAPVVVDFEATVSEEGALYFWNFGGGETAEGASVQHVFDSPGLYPVEVQVGTEDRNGRALAVVSVGGEEGAGAGTTPPADPVLTVLAAKIKAKFKVQGQDRLKLNGLLELPAGFEPAGCPVSVNLAGVPFDFVLDERGRAKDLLGNKVMLRYRRPKDGSPLPGGVLARAKVALRGDFRDRLEASGLRNETEIKPLEGMPFSLLIHELAYPGAADVLLKASWNKAATASTPRR